jgi:Skp family chaperone for outer membrane proteins
MELTEEQLAAAQAELARREAARRQQYHDEYVERERQAEQRFMDKMDRAYPGIDRDTRYSIYSDYRDFYE